MSYQEEILGTVTTVVEQVFEYRFITVPTGDPAPIAATGYVIDQIAINVFGLDIYQEYKAYVRTVE